MPVRKIPKNYRHVTGLVSSRKNHQVRMKAFESPLERDFMLLLEFNLHIKDYEEQPVTIKYKDSSGKTRKYTPDTLVTFRRGDTELNAKIPELCEVKTREELFKNWKDYKPRFKVAIRYCKQRNWRFRIITEKEIRGVYLDNVKFLLPYRQRRINNDLYARILKVFNLHGECTVKEMLNYLESDEWKQVEVLPYVWRMVAERMIGIDLNKPVSMDSMIWNSQFWR